MAKCVAYDISFKRKAVEYIEKASKQASTSQFNVDAKRICECMV